MPWVPAKRARFAGCLSAAGWSITLDELMRSSRLNRDRANYSSEYFRRVFNGRRSWRLCFQTTVNYLIKKSKKEMVDSRRNTRQRRTALVIKYRRTWLLWIWRIGEVFSLISICLLSYWGLGHFDARTIWRRGQLGARHFGAKKIWRRTSWRQENCVPDNLAPNYSSLVIISIQTMHKINSAGARVA